MATIRVAIDNCYGKSSDKKTLETFAEKLRAAGHTVTTHGVGPNRIQQTMLKSSNSCDVMIQIAGGKCLGTLVDFYKGLGSYYHAKAGGFAYFKCWKPEWKAYRAHDDNFSRESDLAPYKGKTLPEIYKIMSEKKKMCYGYGTTAEECASTWLNSYGGNPGGTSSGTDGAAAGGSRLIDIVKELCSDWNKYGVDAILTGDTLNIKKTNPQSATVLNEHNLANNSVSYTEYDNSTPNIYKNAKDNFLINRYGQIPCDVEDENTLMQDQILMMSQRNHGHTIDLKCILNPDRVAGKWVKLTLPRYNIYDRYYYITKDNYNEERSMSLTLERGPPELYVEVQEVPAETTDESGEST
jgi:hypothetical protein